MLRLSDLYENGTKEPELELTVRQININKGCNDSILEKCESLRGYMVFVEKVREKTGAGIKAEDAVTEAVDECIQEKVLTEFFTEHRSEVIEMGIFEYDARLHDQVLREESRMEGKAEGKAEDVLELLEELEPVPKEMRDEILSQKDMDILKVWHKAAAKAGSLEEWKRACNRS